MLQVLVFVSGALGLVYEVLWMRRFMEVFGATTLASAATLSGFFLGLAVGNALFGARAGRWRAPLAAFGALEMGVGAGAVLVPVWLGAYGAVYPTLYSSLSTQPALFAGLKLALALLAIALPAACMGGTLPALAEVAARRPDVGSIARLYAINLAGATVGALAVPFAFLPTLGARGSYVLAVAGSLTVGAAAVLLSRRERVPLELMVQTKPKAAGARSVHAPLVLAAFSGAATLALQSLWTRMFALVHENSIHAFVVIVVVFLLGLAAGAAWARGRRGGLSAKRLLAFGWIAGGMLIAASPRLFHTLTNGLGYLAEAGPGAVWRLIGLAAVLILPPTVALGMAVPLLLEIAGGEAAVCGRTVGRVLGINTVGAIVGPLAVTFVVAPAVGLWWSLVGVGVAIALAGAVAGTARAGRAAVLVVAVTVIVVVRPGTLPAARVDTAAGERLLWVAEGSHGTTAVIEDAHDRWITVNNSYVLGGTAETGEEQWQAHLPLLLHASPRRVAFLGLGTGITAGAARAHPVQRVVALEIVPEVVKAARARFGDANGGLLDDPRVTVVAEDARNHLTATPGAFDVIVGDLLVPWRPGEAALYAQEHFRSARRALASGGVFCQWLPLYQLSEDQAAIVLRTFVEVFPTTSVWRGNFLPDHATLALVGHTEDAPIDAAHVDRRVAALAPVARSHNPFLAHPAGFWLMLVGVADARAPWLPSRRNTDDTPWLELLSPSMWGTGPLGWGGDRLVAFEERVAGSRTLAGTPLAALGADRLAWRDAGAALARASLAGPEGVLALLRGLPVEMQESLEVAGSTAPSRGE